MIEKTQINEKEAWYGEFKIRIFQTIQIFVELFFTFQALLLSLKTTALLIFHALVILHLFEIVLTSLYVPNLFEPN